MIDDDNSFSENPIINDIIKIQNSNNTDLEDLRFSILHSIYSLNFNEFEEEFNTLLTENFK